VADQQKLWTEEHLAQSSRNIGKNIAAMFIAKINSSETPPFSVRSASLRDKDVTPAGVVAAAPKQSVLIAIRKFKHHARRYRLQIVCLGLLKVMTPLAEVAAIWVFKIAVDQMFIPASTDGAPTVVLLLATSTVIVAALTFAETMLSQWVRSRVVFDARQDLLGHLIDLPPDYFDSHPLGDVLTRLSGDVGAVETLVVSAPLEAFGNLVRALVLGVTVFSLSWRLSLAALAVGPLFALLSRYFARRSKEISRERRRHSGVVGAAAEDMLANVPLIQSHGTREAELGRFGVHGYALRSVDMAGARLSALYQPAVDGVELLGALSVICLGTIELSRGRMTIGELFVYIAFLNQLFSPIRALGRFGTSLYSAAASAERVIELLDTPANVADLPTARSVQVDTGLVEFDHVSFTYAGSSQAALQDVSFRLEPGKVVALVGPSGSGKSTIVKLLLRWQEPSAGAVRLDGNDIRNLRIDELRQRFALVSQDAAMVDRTVRENIGYGQRFVNSFDIARAAEGADAADFINALPDGYHTKVGQRGRRLSGGQRQRIAIARALLRHAPILILDEPTSGLDANSSDRIYEPIHRLMTDRATLVVSHNLRMVHDADEILVLDRGQIVERGTHRELRALGGLYEQLYQASLPEHRDRNGCTQAFDGPAKYSAAYRGQQS
jgi:ATP-binding cassette, subfamily B, bacterial